MSRKFARLEGLMDLEMADLVQLKFLSAALRPGCEMVFIDGWSRNHDAVAEWAAQIFFGQNLTAEGVLAFFPAE